MSNKAQNYVPPIVILIVINDELLYMTCLVYYWRSSAELRVTESWVPPSGAPAPATGYNEGW